MKQFEKFIGHLAEIRDNMTDQDFINLENEMYRVVDERASFVFPVQLDEETVEKHGNHIISEKLEQGTNFSFSPAVINADDGQKWLVAFTSYEKISPDQSLSTMTGYADMIFKMVAENDDCAGLIINPDDDFFPLPRDFINFCVEDEEDEEYFEDIYDMMESSGIVYEFMGEEILKITVDDEPADREDILYYTEGIIESVDCNEISAVIYEFPNGDALQYCGGNGLFDAEYVKMVDDKPYINMFTSPRRADLSGEHTYIYCGEEMSEKNTDLIPSDILMDIVGFALSSDFDYSHPDCVATLCEKLGLTKNVFIITDDGMQQIE